MLTGCCPEKTPEKPESFSFVFMTDIHLQPEGNAVNGFQAAIDSVNKLDPDFVITGGDLIMDALGVSYERADSLYNLYDSLLASLHMPVYNTMGNHEVYGIYKESEADPDHPEFAEKMFEKRLGDRYYSFDHKGWHFMILDAIEEPGDYYIGEIDSIQIEWIRKDLEKLDAATPIVLSTHIPFITAVTQIRKGSMAANTPGLVISNTKEILELFDGHNLKLVLQGHLHILEDIYINGIHFITGGAVSGAWWSGPYQGTQEGFILLETGKDDLSWQYFDYGWEVEED